MSSPPAERPEADSSITSIKLTPQYDNLLPAPLSIGNNKGQDVVQYIKKTIGSAYEVDRNAANIISNSCQIVRGLYQNVTVGNLEFVNVKLPRAGVAQAQPFSIVYEPRDVLKKKDVSKVVFVTDGGAWSEKKVRESLTSKYTIDNSWYPVM